MRDFWMDEFAKNGIVDADGTKFEELTNDELLVFGQKCLSEDKFSIFSNPYEMNVLSLDFSNDFLNTLNRVNKKENENLEIFFKALGADPKASVDKKKKK